MQFQIVLGMTSKNKTARHRSESQLGCNSLKVSWEKKRNEKSLKRQDKRQVEYAFSLTQAMEKSKER